MHPIAVGEPEATHRFDAMIILPPTTTERTRPQLARYVIETIEAAGVSVPPSSRFRRLLKLYESGVGTLKPDHPDYESALEGDRDLQLLAFTFDLCGPEGRTDAYLDLLKKLVHDSGLPQQDRKQSPGRDAAFELYIGGVCAAAKLLPVTWESSLSIQTVAGRQGPGQNRRLRGRASR